MLPICGEFSYYEVEKLGVTPVFVLIKGAVGAWPQRSMPAAPFYRATALCLRRQRGAAWQLVLSDAFPRRQTAGSPASTGGDAPV